MSERTLPQIADAFAHHLGRWAADLDAPVRAVLVTAARSVVAETEEGHVCVDLKDVAAACEQSVEAVRSLLLGSGFVALPDGRSRALMVLDAEDRLYLHRYYDYEARLGARLARALRQPMTLPGEAARQTLRALFGTPRVDGGHWQALAAALSLLRRLTVISGGPGTGKTTTVARLLACLLTEHPELRLALAAPTGKAAARLGVAIQRAAEPFAPALQARLKITPTTVHRLLGHSPEGGFRYHAGAPLPVDVVVIDEASMLDVSLATQLLEAVPETARIILLGDRDQLEAVESGAVFAELCASHALSSPVQAALAELVGVAVADVDAPLVPDDPLCDAVIWFTRNYRFHAESAIGRLALAVQAGNADAVQAEMNVPESSVQWLPSPGATPRRQEIAALEDGYTEYYRVAADPASSPAAVLAAFEQFRVLVATREGPWGLHALNQHLTRPLRERLADPGHGPWFRGRPVLVTRNDPGVGLYNGDVGIALPEGNAMRVWFEGAEGLRAVAPSQLPPHETAFAMTVHKSQGSEFRSVALVLPPAPSRLLTRELLYTGITRARENVTLVAPLQSLETAVRSPSQRRSGLRARIGEALAGVVSGES